MVQFLTFHEKQIQDSKSYLTEGLMGLMKYLRSCKSNNMLELES